MTWPVALLLSCDALVVPSGIECMTSCPASCPDACQADRTCAEVLLDADDAGLAGADLAQSGHTVVFNHLPPSTAVQVALSLAIDFDGRTPNAATSWSMRVSQGNDILVQGGSGATTSFPVRVDWTGRRTTDANGTLTFTFSTLGGAGNAGAPYLLADSRFSATVPEVFAIARCPEVD